MIAVIDTTPRRNAPEYGKDTREGHDELAGWLLNLCWAQIEAEGRGDVQAYDFFFEWYKAVSE